MSTNPSTEDVSRTVELANALRNTMEHAANLANQLAALGWKCDARLKPDATRVTAYEYEARIHREQHI